MLPPPEDDQGGERPPPQDAQRPDRAEDAHRPHEGRETGGMEVPKHIPNGLVDLVDLFSGYRRRLPHRVGHHLLRPQDAGLAPAAHRDVMPLDQGVLSVIGDRMKIQVEGLSG